MVEEQEQLAQDLQNKLQVSVATASAEEGPSSTVPPINELTQEQQSDVKVINKLEDFCSSGEFTTFLSDFAREHSSKYTYTEEEQSLECYQVWMDFKSQIDSKLEEFIGSQAEEGLTNEVIMASVNRIHQYNPGFLACIDYLMAAADYQDFVGLMLEFRYTFEYDEEAPDEEEEEQAEGAAQEEEKKE